MSVAMSTRLGCHGDWPQPYRQGLLENGVWLPAISIILPTPAVHQTLLVIILLFTTSKNASAGKILSQMMLTANKY
ncbi:hypothetical protein Y1Q_0014616 [Alligator mississippiensis]|uniref:Uncharacterized protein n=1 Tax=Alligator mississippiensis TaxID=8496 RepID=A0A151P4V3_ALLMI|nr:hypothetical protein Y1Q_0014616 [Alligator mississippiensis]